MMLAAIFPTRYVCKDLPLPFTSVYNPLSHLQDSSGCSAWPFCPNTKCTMALAAIFVTSYFVADIPLAPRLVILSTNG